MWTGRAHDVQSGSATTAISRTLGILALVIGCVAHAAPITYDIINSSDALESIRGSITTDGAHGELLHDDILAWSFRVNGRVNFAISSEQPGARLTCWAGRCKLSATDTALHFDFTNEPPIGGMIFIGYGEDSAGVLTYFAGQIRVICPDAGRFCTGYDYFFSVPEDPKTLIGLASPEASTLALLASAAVALLAAVRSRS